MGSDVITGVGEGLWDTMESEERASGGEAATKEAAKEEVKSKEVQEAGLLVEEGAAWFQDFQLRTQEQVNNRYLFTCRNHYIKVI